MRDPNKRIWFRAARYGWGWGLPVSWQGWGVLITYLLLTGLGVYFLIPGDEFTFYLLQVALTAVLVTVCWIKGETPRWRWGKKDD